MAKTILNSQVREQIAIGVSVVAKCQPCLQYHLKEARKLGVTDNEIEAVIKLSRQIRSMSDQKMDEFVGEALNTEDEISTVTAKERGCCASTEKPEKEKADTSCC